jgi:hypothetical protein
MWCLVGYLTPEEAWERDPNGVWKGYKGKSNYCEKIRHRIPRIYKNKNLSIPTNNNTTSSSTNTFMAQPVNSLSNYTYVAYAFIVFSLFIFDVQLARKSNNHPNNQNNPSLVHRPTTTTLQTFPMWSLILTIAFINIGTTSFLFHASLTRVTQTLDVAAIYQGLGLLLLAYLCRFCSSTASKRQCSYQRQWWTNTMAMVVGVFIMCPLFYVYKSQINTTTMFALLVVLNFLACGTHWYLHRPSMQWWWLVVVTASLGIAVLFRQSELAGWGIQCNPTGLWQNHSAWHFGTATSLFAAVMLFRSEKYVEDGAGGAGGEDEEKGKKNVVTMSEHETKENDGVEMVHVAA